jgi:hypothetical protein
MWLKKEDTHQNDGDLAAGVTLELCAAILDDLRVVQIIIVPSRACMGARKNMSVLADELNG